MASFLDILGGAGRGILGGVEDVGRGLIGQGGGGGRMDMNALAQLIPDEFTRKAFLQMAMPRTQDLLGAVGHVPVLGPVLGTGLDILSTVQAARSGGLGRELAARGIGGALPFQGLGQIAGAREKMQALETEKGRGAVLGAQKGEIEDRIARNRQITDANLRFKDAQTIAAEASGENAKAAAQANLAQAWKYGQEGIAAGRYPSEVLPPGVTMTPENTRTIEGKVVVMGSDGRPYVLQNAPKPGAPGAGEKPPPTNLKTKEQLDAMEAQLPSGKTLVRSEAPGRTFGGQPLFTYSVNDLGGGVLQRGKVLEQFQKYMPSWYGGGTDFRQPLFREQGSAALQQITGMPIPIEQVIGENGQIDEEKLNTVVDKALRLKKYKEGFVFGGAPPAPDAGQP